ncbi:SLC5 family protein [Leptospira sp. GIMC2001]|uniref:SLC5 family protein n=1 Tax=Leptospira sp. GIMC2001 TaxID=1513297 RepID=UPI00234A55D0|nr:sodium/solute symporter [Leptospira sp. GIMC2001]WCL50287.1 sodium/solute symporter [Leptospira sp. GIMC2001]
MNPIYQSIGFLDFFVFAIIISAIPALGIWIGLKKRNSEDYFMAGRSLRWWTVGGTIFGTNVNASHLIGMLGIGYSVGFAQSNFEILAIFAAVILCYVFIPLYRSLNIYTLSEFLELRYNHHVRLIYSILMITLILVQMVGSLYIGARTILFLSAGSPFPMSYSEGLFILSILLLSYTYFGGMSTVVITDSLQSGLIILAAVIISYFTFTEIEIGGLSGLLELESMVDTNKRKMHLFLPSNHPDIPYSGAFTGLLILHMFYWTTNQYLVQRTLAAKSDFDAKVGVMFACFLKLSIPFFSIATGAAAFHLFNLRLEGGSSLIKPDDAFMKLVQVVIPSGYGFIGLILVGLTAATFSSVDSMMNSASTLLSYDVYKRYFRKTASGKELVRFGRIVVIILVFLSAILALLSHNPQEGGNFFLKISARSSYFTPGIVIVFTLGIFWKKIDTKIAIFTLCLSPILGYGIEYLYKENINYFPYLLNSFGYHLNFLHRVFLQSLTILIFIFTAIAIKTSFGRNRDSKIDPDFYSENLSNSSGKNMNLPWLAIGKYILVQGSLLLLYQYSIIHEYFSLKNYALIAGLMGFLGFFLYAKNSRKLSNLEFIKSDLCYSGFMVSVAIFLNYYFF